MQKESIVISLGGSLVAPGFVSLKLSGEVEGIDSTFLRAFKNIISRFLAKRRFFIAVGGGKIARNYQKVLMEFGADTTERDLVGIDVSRLNAKVVKQMFGDRAFSEIVTNPSKKIITRKDVVVAAGWKPGWSTDYCSVVLAKNLGIKTIINITNIDYVYDKDPRRFSSAKAIKEISWKEFRKLTGSKWTPGLSVPFDPRASKMAEILRIKVVIMNGKKLDRLGDFLSGKPFTGTIIS